MNNIKDLTGQVFGRLTVLRLYGKDKKGRAMWECRCECGNIKVVQSYSLKAGYTRSCGCLAHESHVAAGKKVGGTTPGRFKDLTGKVFGYLTVIERGENTSRGQARWKCRCVCGKETLVTSAKLNNGTTISCGCIGLKHATEAKLKHGDALCMHRSRLYKIWAAMKRRCYNPHCDAFPYYGGKGVKVCPEWMRYESFKEWAQSNGYANNLSIDRIDSNGDYEPSNCQWIPMSENIGRAKRYPDSVRQQAFAMLDAGEKQTVIAEALGITRITLLKWRKEAGYAVRKIKK